MSKSFRGVFSSVVILCVACLLLSHTAAPQQITAGAFSSSPMTVRVSGMNFTTTSTSLVPITGLSWALPSTGTLTYSFDCEGSFSNSAVSATIAWGISTSANVTNLNAVMLNSNSPSAMVTSSLVNVTTAGNNTIGSQTLPSMGAGTKLYWHLSGTIENQATTANTINIIADTSSGTLTVYRGSFCFFTP